MLLLILAFFITRGVVRRLIIGWLIRVLPVLIVFLLVLICAVPIILVVICIRLIVIVVCLLILVTFHL